MSTAASIRVREALQFLDGPFSSLAKGVSQCQYAFWLGSGISRERLDDVKAVVERVLVHLQKQVVAGNNNCPYRAALDEALCHARLSPQDRATIDYLMPVRDWPVTDTVLNNLTHEYSRLLDIRVGGHPEPDYLLREAVGAPAAFVAIKTPDCEHLCLAILSLEGVLPDLATANWDGLIESAFDELGNNPNSVLRVCVVPDDFAEAPLQTRLLKFHGCAVRAANNPAKYGHLLIARYSQITDWPTNPDYALMRSELATLAATKRTLMIGLSAQDYNIQFMFSQAKNLRVWDWPCDPPAHVFAEDQLGQDQRNILRVVYGGNYDANVLPIEAGALFRAFAKPALTALVLHVLGAKLCALLQTIDAPLLSEVERETISHGIVALRNRLSTAAEPDRLAFVRKLVQHSSHAMALFQAGTPVVDGKYRPLGNVAVHRIAADSSLSTSGVRELAAALAILGVGEIAGNWVTSAGDLTNPQSGVLRLLRGGNETRVFFAANDRAGVQLEINGLVNADDSDAIVIHSTSPVRRMARSPLAPPGRIGRAGLRDVGMAELLRDAETAENLGERFREEALL